MNGRKSKFHRQELDKLSIEDEPMRIYVATSAWLGGREANMDLLPPTHFARLRSHQLAAVVILKLVSH